MKTKQDNSWVELTKIIKKWTNDTEFYMSDTQIGQLASIFKTEIDKAREEVLDRVDKEVIGEIVGETEEITWLSRKVLNEQQRQKLTQLRQSNNLLGEKK